jgi:fructose-1,6-bisphosphatase/inositol monophosphatase family enzyme
LLTVIEQAAIDTHRESAELLAPPESDGDDLALYLGLRFVLEAGHLVRARRGDPSQSNVTSKKDGSPATQLEERIESQLRRWVSDLDLGITVVGEETGGALPSTGSAIAIDPIDGTRAFLAETETYSTTLALIRDGDTALGIVSNPATGEIAYATAGGESRLIRLSCFGEPDNAGTLRPGAMGASPLLVNVHPNRQGAWLLDTLYRAWQRAEVDMVRSPGGSPAWALVEVARGHFTYVNLWSKRPAQAYDLAAGALIVRRAGGDLTGLEGRPIDALNHSGPFVAGLDGEKVLRVCAVLRAALKSDGTD